MAARAGASFRISQLLNRMKTPGFEIPAFVFNPKPDSLN